MKLGVGMRWGMAPVLLCAVAAFAGSWVGDKKEKPKAASQTVDSGSFGVFVKGQRVVTETFHIQQQNGNSSIKSQLKEVAESVPVDQKSNLEITGAGELLRYDWSEGGPAGGSLTVLPNNEFLIEKISASGTNKAAEQPFLMPNTSMILDNNFFVQREVLAWRYLAAACHPEAGSLQCQKGAVEFGALVPQDRSSMRVRMELVGKEKVTIRGAERELIRLTLTGDGFEWALWVDDRDQFKLIRIAIPADNTEVVRD
ncbi:MAG: hypothetical protein LAO24_01680 [Acidobacteriia bacterium]|nr:hypothetical protein [Terriglobia bacterium]